VKKIMILAATLVRGARRRAQQLGADTAADADADEPATVGPNFVDNDGDGICDNCAGSGQGAQRGKGNGKGQRRAPGRRHGQPGGRPPGRLRLRARVPARTATARGPGQRPAWGAEVDDRTRKRRANGRRTSSSRPFAVSPAAVRAAAVDADARIPPTRSRTRCDPAREPAPRSGTVALVREMIGVEPVEDVRDADGGAQLSSAFRARGHVEYAPAPAFSPSRKGASTPPPWSAAKTPSDGAEEEPVVVAARQPAVASGGHLREGPRQSPDRARPSGRPPRTRGRPTRRRARTGSEGCRTARLPVSVASTLAKERAIAVHSRRAAARAAAGRRRDVVEDALQYPLRRHPEAAAGQLGRDVEGRVCGFGLEARFADPVGPARRSAR